MTDEQSPAVTAGPVVPAESVDEFRQRLEQWLPGNLARRENLADATDEANYARARAAQRKLFDAGFAGICYPREYGGLGHPLEYQEAFNAASLDYDVPVILSYPTLGICGPTILDAGTEAQKRDHVGAMLRGDEVMCQLLSEPSSGSDLASARTRAELSGDTWIVNGTKTWSSAAHVSTHGCLLARTNWDVPKHQGLTMFLVDLRSPGIEVRPIRQTDGRSHFCEVYLTNVSIPVSDVLGELHDGWAVASLQLAHERVTMGGGSRYVSGVAYSRRAESADLSVSELAREMGTSGDARTQELLGEAHALRVVHRQLTRRIARSVARRRLPGTAGTISRIHHADVHARLTDIGLQIAGTAGVVASPDHPTAFGFGERFLMRQAASIGGGTTEMARNVLSERVLGMPREAAADRDIPFRDVPSAG